MVVKFLGFALPNMTNMMFENNYGSEMECAWEQQMTNMCVENHYGTEIGVIRCCVDVGDYHFDLSACL